MGKNDPMKGNAGDYAKKAQQKRGVQDPLSDIDMDDEMLADPRDPKGPQRTGRPSDESQRRNRSHESMDEPAEDRWDM